MSSEEEEVLMESLLLALLPFFRSIPALLPLLLLPSLGSDPERDDIGPNVPRLSDVPIFAPEDVFEPPVSSPPLSSLSEVFEELRESAAAVDVVTPWPFR
jgi:hypothetical protein